MLIRNPGVRPQEKFIKKKVKLTLIKQKENITPQPTLTKSPEIRLQEKSTKKVKSALIKQKKNIDATTNTYQKFRSPPARETYEKKSEINTNKRKTLAPLPTLTRSLSPLVRKSKPRLGFFGMKKIKKNCR